MYQTNKYRIFSIHLRTKLMSEMFLKSLVLTFNERVYVRFPAPHLSHPTLPPIRGPPKSTRPPRTLSHKPTTGSSGDTTTIQNNENLTACSVPLQTLSTRNLPLYRLTRDTGREPWRQPSLYKS